MFVASVMHLQTMTMFDMQNQSHFTSSHLSRFGVCGKQQTCGTGLIDYGYIVIASDLNGHVRENFLWQSVT